MADVRPLLVDLRTIDVTHDPNEPVGVVIKILILGLMVDIGVVRIHGQVQRRLRVLALLRRSLLRRMRSVEAGPLRNTGHTQ